MIANAILVLEFNFLACDKLRYLGRWGKIFVSI
jgi:hypothetical protein